MSIKKMRWLVLILVGLLILSIGGYLIVDAVVKKKEAAEAAEAASLILFEFDSASICEVSVDGKEGKFVMKLGANGEWFITETDYSYQFSLNSSYLNTVCSYMGALTAEKKFNVDMNKLDTYGLADPIVLTCTDTAGKSYTLHVGNATATQEHFYVMVPGNDTVFGIAYETGALLTADTNYLKNSYMLSFYDVEIAELGMYRTGKEPLEMQLQDGKWMMESPLKDANISNAEVNTMLTSITRIELATYLERKTDNTDLSRYGLEDPMYTFIVKNTEGETITIHFSSLEFDDSYVYLLYEETGEIASLLKNSAGFLNMDVSEFLVSKIHAQNIASVSAVEATVDDITFTMEMDQANGQYTYNSIDVDALGEEAVTMFGYLFDTMSNVEYDSMDLEADPDLEQEPAIRFCYTLTDGTQTELALIAIDDTTYWAVVDGKYTGMIVRRRAISGNSGVLTYYEKMNDLMAELQESDS